MLLKKKSIILVIISSAIITIVIVITLIGHFLYIEMKNREAGRNFMESPAGR